MSAILARLAALLGRSGVERDPGGVPRAIPDSPEAVAVVCQLAQEEGWKIRIEGRGSWQAPDAPADLALTVRGLDRIRAVSPADLVATVEAGVTVDALRRHLAEQGMWLALDPPGRPERTIGSVVATATAGPLRAAFGSVRDHVLGCTTVSGDGRVLRPGGRVVKNVAGFDLTKLQVGGFGAFGVLTDVHLRLRALPRADRTLVARGARDALTSAARDLASAGAAPAALELLSPALAAEPEWVLAARLLGTDAAVEAEARRLEAQAPLGWQALEPEKSAGFWGLAARGVLAGPVTLRLGVLPDGLDEAIDLVVHRLDEGLIAAGALGGGLRWTGEATPEALRLVRHTAAPREVPMTVERAPWEVRRAVGHFGAYREGVGPLVDRLREAFDPGQSLSVALEAFDRA